MTLLPNFPILSYLSPVLHLNLSESLYLPSPSSFLCPLWPGWSCSVSSSSGAAACCFWFQFISREPLFSSAACFGADGDRSWTDRRWQMDGSFWSWSRFRRLQNTRLFERGHVRLRDMKSVIIKSCQSVWGLHAQVCRNQQLLFITHLSH